MLVGPWFLLQLQCSVLFSIVPWHVLRGHRLVQDHEELDHSHYESSWSAVGSLKVVPKVVLDIVDSAPNGG